MWELEWVESGSGFVNVVSVEEWYCLKRASGIGMVYVQKYIRENGSRSGIDDVWARSRAEKGMVEIRTSIRENGSESCMVLICTRPLRFIWWIVAYFWMCCRLDLYSVDTQVFAHMRLCEIHCRKSNIGRCVLGIQDRCSEKWFQLNPNKVFAACSTCRSAPNDRF